MAAYAVVRTREYATWERLTGGCVLREVPWGNSWYSLPGGFYRREEMLVEGRVLKEGRDIVGYLDEKLHDLLSKGYMATGIVIGTQARSELSKACQEILGQKAKDDMTVNRFRNALLIEDGQSPWRVEIIFAKNPTLPVEGQPLNLKRLGR